MGYERFTDRKDANILIKKVGGFRIRRHGLPPAWVVVLFVILLLGFMMLIINLSLRLVQLKGDVYSANSPVPISEIVAFLSITIFAVTIIVMYFSYLVSKIKNTVSESEFLNMVFSGVVRLDSEFCLIVNSDKDVVYFDEGFNSTFPRTNEHSNNLDRILLSRALKTEDSEKIVKAISASERADVAISCDDNSLRISVEPLERPAGYSVIRGYKVK